MGHTRHTLLTLVKGLAALEALETVDRGKSWQRLRGGLPERLPATLRAVASDPDDPNAFFIGMTTGSVWMTEDGGESFREIPTGLPQMGSVAVIRR